MTIPVLRNYCDISALKKICMCVCRSSLSASSTCSGHTHDVTDLLQVSLAFKQVRLHQLKGTTAVLLSQHFEDLAQEETEASLEVAALKLNGESELEGGGQNTLTSVLRSQFP